MPTLPILRRRAELIERRVLQLERHGLRGRLLAVQMAPHLPDLQLIWDNMSDTELIQLCRDYPGFEWYASVMEAAINVEWCRPSADIDALMPLPEPLKSKMVALVKTLTALERGWQSVLAQDRSPARDHAVGVAAPTAALARRTSGLFTATACHRVPDETY
jgi:hypothetical protein